MQLPVELVRLVLEFEPRLLPWSGRALALGAGRLGHGLFKWAALRTGAGRRAVVRAALRDGPLPEWLVAAIFDGTAPELQVAASALIGQAAPDRVHDLVTRACGGCAAAAGRLQLVAARAADFPHAFALYCAAKCTGALPTLAGCAQQDRDLCDWLVRDWRPGDWMTPHEAASARPDAIARMFDHDAVLVSTVPVALNAFARGHVRKVRGLAAAEHIHLRIVSLCALEDEDAARAMVRAARSTQLRIEALEHASMNPAVGVWRAAFAETWTWLAPDDNEAVFQVLRASARRALTDEWRRAFCASFLPNGTVTRLVQRAAAELTSAELRALFDGAPDIFTMGRLLDEEPTPFLGVDPPLAARSPLAHAFVVERVVAAGARLRAQALADALLVVGDQLNDTALADAVALLELQPRDAEYTDWKRTLFMDAAAACSVRLMCAIGVPQDCSQHPEFAAQLMVRVLHSRAPSAKRIEAIRYAAGLCRAALGAVGCELIEDFVTDGATMSQCRRPPPDVQPAAAWTAAPAETDLMLRPAALANMDVEAALVEALWGLC